MHYYTKKNNMNVLSSYQVSLSLVIGKLWFGKLKNVSGSSSVAQLGRVVLEKSMYIAFLMMIKMSQTN